MNVTRKRLVLAAVGLALTLVGVLAVAPSVRFLAAVVIFTRKWSQQAEQGRNHLFSETDYQELLAACRELSKRVAAGELRGGHYSVYLGKRDPETLSFPQVILDLKPAEVLTDFHRHGEVIIVLFPGPEWFGVRASPEGSEEYGGVKLIQGLWYFDNNCGPNHPKYAAWINDMVEKGRQLRASRAVAQPQVTQQKL